MGVHDQDTKKFFKNSGVRCVLAPRYADNKLSWFQQQVHILHPTISTSLTSRGGQSACQSTSCSILCCLIKTLEVKANVYFFFFP